MNSFYYFRRKITLLIPDEHTFCNIGRINSQVLSNYITSPVLLIGKGYTLFSGSRAERAFRIHLNCGLGSTVVRTPFVSQRMCTIRREGNGKM